MASAFILPAISGIAGFLGGMAPKKTTTDYSGSQQQNQNFQNYGSSTPNLSPLQQMLAAKFTQGALDQYNRGTNLAPYTSGGLQGIQTQGQQNSRAIASNLASRGLSYSPMAGAATTQNQLNTGNQMQGFLQGVPLLQRQLQSQNLGQLISAFSALPTGVDTSSAGNANSYGTTQGTQTTTGGGGIAAGIAGGLSGFGSGLAAPYGLSPDTNTPNNLSQILAKFGIGQNSGYQQYFPPGAGQQPASQTQYGQSPVKSPWGN